MTLLTRLLLYVLTPFLVVSLLVLFAVGQHLENLLRDEISNSARSTMQMQAAAVENLFASQRQSLRILAATSALQSGDLAVILPQLAKWQQQSREIENLYFNTLDGFAHDIHGKSVAVGDRPYFTEIRRGNAQISPPIISRDTGHAIVIISEPVHASDGRLLGALAASLDIGYIIEWLKKLRADPRATTILTDRQGLVLAGFSDETFPLLSAPSLLQAPKTATISAQPDVDKDLPQAITISGQRWQFFHSHIPITGWKLGLAYPEEVIFAIVEKAWVLGIWIIAALSLAAILAVYFFNRSLILPIRQLASAQSELEHGNLSIRIGKHAEDELGQLSSSFDHMAERLEASVQAALRAETRFRLQFENATDAIFLLDQKLFVDCNPATETLFGISRAELLNTTPLALSPAQQGDGRDTETTGQAYLQAALDGSPQKFPWLHQHRDGHLIKAEVSLKRLELDGRVLLQAIVRDVSARDDAVAQVKTLEEKFQRIFQASPDYMIVARLEDGLIIEANEGFERLTGYSRSEAVGRTTVEIGVWEHPEERLRLVAQMREKGLVRNFAFHLRRRDGVIREVLGSVGTVELDETPHYVAIVHDVSDERTIQRALAASELRLKSILEAAPLSIVVNRTSDFSYLSVNPAYEKLLGYPAQSVIGKTPKGIGAIRHNDAVMREQTLRLLANGRVDNEPSELLTADGRQLSCIYSSRLLELDGEPVIVSITTDITRQKQIEEGLRQAKAALTESETRFAALFQSSPIALAVFRGEASNYKVSELNEAWFNTFGYPTKDVVGKSTPDFGMWLHNEDRTHVLNIIEETGELRGFEAWLHCHDGNSILCAISARLITLSEYQLLLVAYVDITEKRRIEEEIRQLNASLETRIVQRTEELQRTQSELMRSEKLAALGALVAGVAHELNTPIGNSLTVATSLLDRTAEIFAQLNNGMKRSALEAYLADATQGAGILERNLQRASELIQSFKSIAIDQASDQRRRFDLKQIAEEILHTLRPSLKKKPYQICLDIPAGLLLDSYPGPLEQVIVNLVNNAILHGFDGREQGTVTIRAEAAGDQIVLEVQDDGVGISETNLPRIFDPFFTTKLGKGGSGLGLHIVHNIVCDVLGGHIEARSLASGTVMHLSIPVLAPEIQA